MPEFLAVLEQFATLLDERLSQKDVLTKEDAVRYTFFLALRETDFCHHAHVMLEYPHPNIPGKEVDTYIVAYGDRKPVMVEFKYDKQSDKAGKSDQNKTHRAGAVFRDMCRLADMPPEHRGVARYFVYLTDRGMKYYFSNPKNGLKEVFDISVGASFPFTKTFVDHRPPTFRKVIKPYLREFTITGVFGKTLNKDHFLRIYSVTPAIADGKV